MDRVGWKEGEGRGERGRESIDGVGMKGDGGWVVERRSERKGRKEGGWMTVWMEWIRSSRKERGRESRGESGKGKGREDECVDKVAAEERVERSDGISEIYNYTNMVGG